MHQENSLCCLLAGFKLVIMPIIDLTRDDDASPSPVIVPAPERLQSPDHLPAARLHKRQRPCNDHQHVPPILQSGWAVPTVAVAVARPHAPPVKVVSRSRVSSASLSAVLTEVDGGKLIASQVRSITLLRGVV